MIRRRFRRFLRRAWRLIVALCDDGLTKEEREELYRDAQQW